MDNEERAQLETGYKKEMESLRKDVARLTSLLEQALKSKSGEGTSSQPSFTAQFQPMPTTSFIPPSEPHDVDHFLPA
jgi:hypothetical protein